MDLNTASSLSNRELGRQGWTVQDPLVSHGLTIMTPVYPLEAHHSLMREPSAVSRLLWGLGPHHL